jgi:hypothetical protein
VPSPEALPEQRDALRVVSRERDLDRRVELRLDGPGGQHLDGHEAGEGVAEQAVLGARAVGPGTHEVAEADERQRCAALDASALGGPRRGGTGRLGAAGDRVQEGVDHRGGELFGPGGGGRLEADVALVCGEREGLAEVGGESVLDGGDQHASSHLLSPFVDLGGSGRAPRVPHHAAHASPYGDGRRLSIGNRYRSSVLGACCGVRGQPIIVLVAPGTTTWTTPP